MPSKYSSLDIEIPSDLKKPFKKVTRLANLITSCFMCLFSILNILLLLIILTTHSLTIENDFTELLPIAEFISANVNAAPVTNIALASNMTCPKGWEFQVLTTWPGTVQGCYCYRTGQLYSGECVEADKDLCQTVYPISPQSLSIWNNKAFCLLRASDYLLKSYNQDCLAGYKACSKFCIPEAQACPITDIALQTSDSVTGDQEYIAFNDTSVLVLKRDPNHDVLSSIGASFYGPPCLQQNRLNEKNDGTVYPLLNVPSAGCGVYGVDIASTIVEGLNTNVFLDQNNLTAVNDLPYFFDSEANSDTYLIARSRLHLANSDQCQELGTQHLSILVDLLSSFKKWMIGATIFPMIVIAAYLIYLTFLLFDEGLKKFYKKASKRWVSWILFTLCLVTVILYNNYLSAENIKIVDQQIYYTLLGAANCFANPNISLVLATFALAIPMGSVTITGYAQIMFWTSIVFYAIAVIAMILKVIYKKMND